ncbi:MAG TPA: hypothetical protein PLW48_04550 [Alphaproteobacteria bacterium]|nr:hypothetical protein [Rhodospirillaceae bacterium]HRJ66386.1 hypothetical protein [Alphaproteobacteria bacterium]
MPVPTADVQKPLNPDTRLARMMLPEIDPHSALLPTNKWIINTVKDMVKTHAGIRGCLKRAAAFTLGGIAAIGAGIAGAVMAPTLLIAGGIAAASLGAAAGFGFFARREGLKIKTDYMGDVQEIVKNKYMEMKANELKRAWQERAAQVKREREEKRAAEAARKAAEAQAKADAAAAPQKPEEPAKTDAPQSEGKAASMLKTFGRWAAVRAKQGAHAIEDKIHDALEDKPQNGAGDASKKNAPPKNGAPKNGG